MWGVPTSASSPGPIPLNLPLWERGMMSNGEGRSPSAHPEASGGAIL